MNIILFTKKELLICSFLLLIVFNSFSQGIKITGEITVGLGSEKLPGVTIIEKDTRNGVISNSNGKYEITVTNSTAVLVFSSIGFQSQEIEIGNKTIINVNLKEDVANLDEVVVVGYGTQKKSDLTGSVAKADIEAFKEAPNVNLLQSLQGSVAGLNVGVATASGSSPSLSIRGQNTLSSSGGDNAPLIVLDGIIYRGSIGDINPKNIESVEVLKDASSTAIYGSQASNGVILLTTKKGSGGNGKPIISYSGQYSFQTPSNEIRPSSAAEYEKALTDALWEQSKLAPEYTQPNPDFSLAPYMRTNQATKNYKNGKHTDWWNLLTGNGSIIDHNVSISGGDNKYNYFISGGMTNQKGFIVNDQYKRYSGQANLNFILNKWLSVGVESLVSFKDQSGLSRPVIDRPVSDSDTKTRDAQNSAVENAFYSIPFISPYDDDGNVIINPDPLYLNPILESQKQDSDKSSNIFANLHADINVPFIKGLNYRINYGQSYRTAKVMQFNPWGADLTGSGNFSFNDRYDWTVDNIINYKKNLNNTHKLEFTGLYGVEKRQLTNRYATAENFVNKTLGFNRLQAGDPSLNGISVLAEEERSLYTMGRIFYGLKNKYMFTGTVRKDGFSGFGEKNKTGIFPSVALAWNISNEPFFNSISDKINLLKLRGSYGVTARRGLSRYETLARIGSSPVVVFGDGNNATIGQYISSLSNPNLTWETTTGLNLGLDFGIFNSRIFGNIEYYTNNTENILYDIKLPGITGFKTIATNIGKVANRGFEFSLTGQVIKTKDLNWSSTVNFSTYRNKIVSVLGFDNDGDGKEDDLVANLLFIGKPKEVIFDYTREGIWQLADVDNIPAGFFPGTYKVKDLNGDGELNSDDRSILGYKDPGYRVSWSNRVNYKNFSLFVFINSIQGGKNYYMGSHNPNSGRLAKTDQITYSNSFYFNYWTPDNPDAKYRRLTGGGRLDPGVYQQRNFVRIQDITLSYNFTNLLGESFNNLKLYISGKNLATFTKWEGWDPEVGGNPGSGLPVMRSYAVGLNVEF